MIHPMLRLRNAAPNPRSILWLAPALVMIPVFLLAAMSEEANLPNAFQSVSTSAILWFPCLAVISVFRGRFVAFHATLATLVFVAYDSLRIREVLYEGLDPLIGFGGNPNWVTLCVMLAATGLLIAVTLLRPTLYRVVVASSCTAQLVTLVLFHTLIVIQPILVANDTEREFIAEFAEATGGIDALCGLQGRICHSGSPEQLASRLEEDLLAPSSVIRMLRDEADAPRVLFTWTESAFASTADEAMRHISVFKPAVDEAIVMINQRAPTQAFGTMKISFSILAGLFQQTWMTLALLILWRHADYRLTSRGWRRF